MPARPRHTGPRRATARLTPHLAAALAAGVCVAAPGCAAIKQKWEAAIATDVANPALPAKPIRVPGRVVSDDPGPAGGDLRLAGADAGGSVRTADASGGSVAPAGVPRFDDADAVASVNGEPLFAGDLLQFEARLMLQDRAIEEAAARVAAVPDRGDEAPGEPPGLTAAQRSAVNAQIEAGRADLHAHRARALAQILPGKIEEALLAQMMRRTLEKEQLERLDGMVAGLFEETRLPELLAETSASAAARGLPPVRTKEELRRAMEAQGLSMEAFVAAWKPRQMAMAYVEQKTGAGSIRVSRQEVADYYDAHLADFTPPKEVRFEQIVIPYPDDVGKTAALDLVEVAAADLRRGRPFAEVAADYSRGPNANAGGRWDWTAPSSLTDPKVAAAVWEQPPGEVGPPIDSPLSEDGFPPGGAYTLVRVTQRRGETAPPLDELRGRIENLIKGERRQRSVIDLIAEERDAAQIEIFVPGVVWPPEEKG